MKTYADTRRHTQISEIHTGDEVLLRNQERGKLIPTYDPDPYVVVEKKGSQVTAERQGRRLELPEIHHFSKW